MTDLLNRTIVPTLRREQDLLEREADRLLTEAGHRIDRDGILWAASGDRVLSLDGFRDSGLEPEVIEPPEEQSMDRVDRFVAEVTDVAGLAKQEARITEVIAEGEVWSQGTGIWARAASRLNTTPTAIKDGWKRTKRKLIREWATEPDEHEKRKLRHSAEGSDRLIIGKGRPWGKRVSFADRAEARMAQWRSENG